IDRGLPEAVADQDAHAGPLPANRPDQLFVVRHAAGGKRLQPGEQRRGRAPASIRRTAGRRSVGEHGQTHAVERRQPHVGDRAGPGAPGSRAGGGGRARAERPPCYALAGSLTVCSKMSLIRRSAVIPSASASNCKKILWRKAGCATALTSSKATL